MENQPENNMETGIRKWFMGIHVFQNIANGHGSLLGNILRAIPTYQSHPQWFLGKPGVARVLFVTQSQKQKKIDRNYIRSPDDQKASNSEIPWLLKTIGLKTLDIHPNH